MTALNKFCDKVDAIVAAQYDIEDGGDLCYHLIGAGVIDMADGPDEAARVVAQHIEQA